MALFKKNEPQTTAPRERVNSRNQSDAAISIIATGMEVVGDIATEGTVRVEGHVEGTIRAGKAVVLGQGGVIDGNVMTQDAVIGGKVNGSIVASNRLELQSTCTVEGEISTRAQHLKLEEGARFAGQVQMLEDEPPAPSVVDGNNMPQLMAGEGEEEAEAEGSEEEEKEKVKA